MRVLLSAYSCEPGRGSEPGAGWGWSLAAARDHEAWVITRAVHAEAIERALAGNASPTLHPVYVELPRWLSFWQRGERRLRLHYVLWQVAAAARARRLHREVQFDVVHHVTFTNVWLPALAWLVPAPLIVGPAGGGPTVPLRLLPSLGVAGAARELARSAARRLSGLNPLVRIGLHRAETIIVQNRETLERLPRRCRARSVLRSLVVLAPMMADDTGPRDEHVIVCAGRLLPWKGFSLALRALRELPDRRLLLVGAGPDLPRLRRSATRLGVADRVEFVPWLDRVELWRRIAEAGVLLVPSVRDDGPYLAAEGVLLGTPVVALDQGGAATLARRHGLPLELVAPTSVDETARALARALADVRLPDGDLAGAVGIDAAARDLTSIYAAAAGRRSPALVPEAVA